MAYNSGTINLTKKDYATAAISVEANAEKAAVAITSESIGIGSASISFEWSVDQSNFFAFSTAVNLSTGASSQAKEGIDVRGVRFVRFKTRIADGDADPSAKFAVNTA